MSFVYRNMLPMVLAVSAAVFAWLYGGTIGSVMLGVAPWLCLLMLEGMLFFPQRHKDETSFEARERVWETLKRDPLTLAALAFAVILAIPFVNAGLCPTCDAEAIAAGANPDPLVRFLPFCLNRLHHLNVFLWFLPALIAMLAVRHSLTRNGKRTFLEMVVWNGVALAVVGVVQQVAHAPGPLWSGLMGNRAGYFFSTFGYTNMGGDYFTTLFGLSVALWRFRVDEVRKQESDLRRDGRTLGRHFFWHKHYLLIPACINFVGAMSTLSRAAIILVSTLAVVFFFHAAITFLSRMKKAVRVKAGAYSCLILIIIAVLASIFMPDDLQREVSTLNSGEVLNRVTGKDDALARQSIRLWKEYPIFGCGGWGFMHLQAVAANEVDPEKKFVGSTGGINVHNDYLQFLTEHGVVGFACLVAMVGILLIPVSKAWCALAKAARFAPKGKAPPSPRALFALPAGAFCVLATAAATLVHAFGDCPLRSPAVLFLFFTELAALDGFIPHGIHQSKSNDKGTHHHVEG